MAATRLIERARLRLPTWTLVRGEHFLAEIGIHPKALEAFDYYTGIESGRRCDVPAHCKTDVDLLREHSWPVKRIEEQLAGHPSAREYFIAQLDAHLQNAASASSGGNVIYRTTDFKAHDLADLEGAELFETAETHGPNPDWGLRGLSRYLQPSYQDLLAWELEACRRSGAIRPVELALIFPFVRFPRELREAIARVDAVAVRPAALGMMIEVASNVFHIADFVDLLTTWASHGSGRSMFLFGLGDLAATAGGVARGSPDVTLKVHPEVQKLSPEIPSEIDMLDQSALCIHRMVEHVLAYALPHRVSCGIHAHSLESIAGQNPQFATLLAGSLTFLVEDYCFMG